MLVIAVVAAVVAGSAFAYWSDDRFPARSAPLAGTPVELRIQDGVTARELRTVRVGIRLTDRYLRRSLHRGVRGPAQARIARRDRCGHSQSGERAVIGTGNPGFLCVDTSNVEWKAMLNEDRPAATAVSAHEYVHVWQAELGCLPQGDKREYRWMVEGMATHLAWEALRRAGLVSERRVLMTIRREGAFDPSNHALRTYERRGGRPPQYALWHRAIRALLREAVARAAAPRGRPEMSLRRFCERAGGGIAWREAFTRTFGLSPAEFYARFGAGR